MATAAKYPAALMTQANIGGELASMPSVELTLNADITNASGTLVVNEAIPASWPAAGWIILDSEVIHYSAFNAGTKTFTLDVRGDQTTYGAGAAAGHTAGAIVGLYFTAQQWNQLVAEVIALETQLQKNFMKRQAVTITTGTETVDLSAGDYIVLSMTANWGTPTISNPVDGHVYVFEIVQDATGSRTITWPAAFTFAGGTKTLSVAANAVDLVTAMYNGGSSKYRAVLSTAYA